MRPIDADAFKKYIDAQEGRPFIGCTVGEAMKILIDEQPTVQPEPTDIDAREAVYNLAEKIGIHQLFALTVELRGEPIQPEPHEGHWIPVSERLPDKSGEYLVTTQWLNGDIDVSLYEYSATYKEWNDGDMCGQKVIAWMPLPEAFKPNK